jgi:hypothetical protein
MAAFGEHFYPLLEKASYLFNESTTINEIRDALLPRLISADFEIPAELLEA